MWFVSSSHLFFQSISLYQHGHMHIYFTFWVIIQDYLICFSHYSSFGHPALVAGSCITLIYSNHCAVFYFVLSHATRWPSLIIYISCPNPRSSHFTKEPRFLLLENMKPTWVARLHTHFSRPSVPGFILWLRERCFPLTTYQNLLWDLLDSF